MEEEREVLRDANGQVLDETKSVKVGLDREELMAEFAILAEEEKEEEERAQAVFVEAVENLKLYSQLDLESIARLLSVLEDSGRDEGAAWEYFFQQGAHQVLLVLLNAEEVVEDQRRTDQILQMWERIARFVFKLSEEDQGVVYDELRRQGMVETLAFAMRHHPHHPPVLRRGAFLLAQLFAQDAPAKHSDEDPSARTRMLAAEGLVDLFRTMESQPATYSPDLLAKVREMREAVEGGKGGGAGEKKSQSQHRGQQAAAAAAVEAETKRAEEVERAHKQEAETRHAARVRLADELIEAGPSPTEKAPLLSAHQRHAGVNQVVTGDGCCSACVLM